MRRPLGGRREWRRRLARAALLVATALPALGGCGGSAKSPGVLLGGESHFLVSCSPAGCGDGLECLAGICTRSCDVAVDSCSDLSSSAACTDGGSAAGSPGGRCDVECVAASDCAAWPGYLCQSGLCRAPAAEPGADGLTGAAAGLQPASSDGSYEVPGGATGLPQRAPDGSSAFCVGSNTTTAAGDFFIQTQSGIDQLTGCEEIDGALTIDGPDGDSLDLAPLSFLRRVAGRLVIGCDAFGAPDVSCGVPGPRQAEQAVAVRSIALRGLDNLESVGSLLIGQLGVEDLTRLRGLRSIVARADRSNADGGLRIVNCDAVASLDGLQSLTELRSLSLQGNAELTTLSGLSLPATMERVHIESAWLLENLSRLETVTALGSLELRDLPVANLDALRNLSALNRLSLIDLWALTELRGLSQIRALDTLYLDSTALHDLDDLQVQSIANVELRGHGRLTQVDALGPASISALIAMDNTTLLSMPAFPNVQQMGQINIQGNPSLLTAPGFPNLVRVTGGPIVFANTGVREVAFPALTEAASIEIHDNYNLSSLDLSSLTRAASLQVTCNALSEASLEPLRQVSVDQRTLGGSADLCVAPP